MAATADMHKQKVSATVAVTNSDKTTQTYACEAVNVLDPESVDMVLIVADVNDSKYGEPNRASLPPRLHVYSAAVPDYGPDSNDGKTELQHLLRT